MKGVKRMTLATEILCDMKRTCKRWKVAFYVMVAIEIVTLLVR